MANEWLSVKQMGEYLNVSISTVRRRITQNMFTVRRQGRRILLCVKTDHTHPELEDRVDKLESKIDKLLEHHDKPWWKRR